MKILWNLLLVPGWIGNSILRGYVLTVLWSWFVVSQFHVPRLHIVGAVGLCILIGLFNMKAMSDEDARKLMDSKGMEVSKRLSLKARWFQVAGSAFASLVTLLSGWIWHSFF